MLLQIYIVLEIDLMCVEISLISGAITTKALETRTIAMVIVIKTFKHSWFEEGPESELQTHREEVYTYHTFLHTNPIKI